jgi:hypothetical protein
MKYVYSRFNGSLNQCSKTELLISMKAANKKLLKMLLMF